MEILYERYLDQVLGGWLGKSMGGAIGARFEGNKGWIEIMPEEMFPEKMPPNDDLDLQVLWLKVLEEKGAALTSDDLADAWLEGCWYPFNEYGIFRRNYRLGVHPPYSGRLANQFWETGMGCPIRAEIWGYVFPGAPDLAAKYAEMDGVLDHTEQSVGAEKMFAAMASMAFFVPDVQRLASMFIHHLPKGTEIERLTREAFRAREQGLSLREARDRLMAVAGNPEACDSRTNVPFTFLGILYGGNDLVETMLAALRCGYDTDCTLATSGALIGQILGASRIAKSLKDKVGDELVMGIEYRRREMTISALARDTVRVGVLLAGECKTGVNISGAPKTKPLPASARMPATRISVDYEGLPAAAPGDTVNVIVTVEGAVPEGAMLTVKGPAGWVISPAKAEVSAVRRSVKVALHAPAKPETWPMKNLFTASVAGINREFGVAGAALWKFLGLYYDALPDEKDPVQCGRRMNHHFVSLKKEYLREPDPDEDRLFREWSIRLGKPAILPSYENDIDLTRLTGLIGPFCAYLSRSIISPDERPAFVQIGNTDGYRLYLNGALVAEVDEYAFWTPINNVHKITLKKGVNHIFLKLLKRGDEMKFTLGFREARGRHGQWCGCEDWIVDTEETLP